MIKEIRPTPLLFLTLMSSANSLTWSSFGHRVGLAVILILVLCFSASAHEGLVEPTAEQRATVKTCHLTDRPKFREESILLI